MKHHILVKIYVIQYQRDTSYSTPVVVSLCTDHHQGPDVYEMITKHMPCYWKGPYTSPQGLQQSRWRDLSEQPIFMQQT